MRVSRGICMCTQTCINSKKNIHSLLIYTKVKNKRPSHTTKNGDK